MQFMFGFRVEAVPQCKGYIGKLPLELFLFSLQKFFSAKKAAGELGFVLNERKHFFGQSDLPDFRSSILGQRNECGSTEKPWIFQTLRYPDITAHTICTKLGMNVKTHSLRKVMEPEFRFLPFMAFYGPPKLWSIFQARLMARKVIISGF